MSKYKVLIFGTGHITEKIIYKVIAKYNVVGFLDNSLEKQHRLWKDTNKYIYAPNEINDIEFDKVIIASTNYASEMFLQLLNLGVREHDIIVDYVCKSNNVYIYDLLKMQNDKYGDFNRMDIVVKYMAIESYMNGDDNGIELYKKMQQMRLKITEEQAENEWSKFKCLINMVQKKGYMNDSFIVCDEMLHIMDGAHRLAICLYLKIFMIPVKMSPQKFECDYNIEWFWKNDFKLMELKKIEDTFLKIKNFSSHEIVAFIWPPAMKYFSQIIEELKYFVEVCKIETKKFDDVELPDLIRRIYSVDDIEDWKVEKKIKAIRRSENVIAIITLKIEKPKYRIKAQTALPLSKKVEELKEIVRNRYKKRVDDYYFDNIIHICDNYYQSVLIKKILNLPLNISECFEKIKKYRYVISKFEVPYMVYDFPYSFPVHKDSDILCLSEDFEKIVQIISDFVEIYSKNNDLVVRRINSENRIKIRLEYLNFLIYQFDISSKIDCLGDLFVDNAVKRRIPIDIFYVMNQTDEFQVRKIEYEQYPNKKYHLDYINKYNFTNNI